MAAKISYDDVEVGTDLPSQRFAFQRTNLVQYAGASPARDDDADGFIVNKPRRASSTLGTVRGVKPRRRIDVVRLLRTSRDQR